MVKFDYNQLTNLANEAGRAATEATNYANDLDNKIKNPINNYSGSHTGNINTAYSRVQAKSKAMRQKATSLGDYKTKVTTFKNNVETGEKKLAGRIKSLMGSFKKRWNIKDPSWLEQLLEGICDFLGLGDLFDSFRRFLKDLKAFLKHLWEEVKDWYHFKGGAELVDAIVAIVITIVLVVVDIALTIVTAGAWKVVTVIIVFLTCLIAFANAVAKVSQYMETFGKDHVLHKSANNKIASEMDAATKLRRMGMYDAATIFQITEVVVGIINLFKDVGEFFKNWKNVIKTSKGGRFTNVWKNLKSGFSKFSLKSFKEAKSAKNKAAMFKWVKNYTKIANGIYSMIRTNNFGKNSGQAFWDTVKAGKDTWDTLAVNTIGNMWNFDFDTKDAKNPDPGHQKMSDIWNSYLKDGVTYTNKAISAYQHANLNLSNFQYNANINKPSDGVSKAFTAIGSPSKMMSFIAGKIESATGSNYAFTSNVIVKPLNWAASTAKTGFNISFHIRHPVLGFVGDVWNSL